MFNGFLFKQYDGSSGLWEDEETRIFYENLRDLKSFLPGVMLSYWLTFKCTNQGWFSLTMEL